MGEPLPTRWFDGRSPRGRAVQLRVEGDELVLEPLDAERAEPPRRYPLREVRWPERRTHGQRQTELPDGGLIQHADAGGWDAWWVAQGLRESWVVGWQQSWRATAAAVVGAVAVLLASWFWGVPVASQFVAQRLPHQPAHVVLFHAEQVHDGGLHIVHMHGVFCDVPAKIVGGAKS